MKRPDDQSQRRSPMSDSTDRDGDERTEVQQPLTQWISWLSSHFGMIAVLVPFGIVVVKVLVTSGGNRAIAAYLLGELDTKTIVLGSIVSILPGVLLIVIVTAAVAVRLRISEKGKTARLHFVWYCLCAASVVAVPYSAISTIILAVIVAAVGALMLHMRRRMNFRDLSARSDALKVRVDAARGGREELGLDSGAELRSEIETLREDLDHMINRADRLDRVGARIERIGLPYIAITVTLVTFATIVVAPWLPEEEVKVAGRPTAAVNVLSDSDDDLVVFHREELRVERVSKTSVQWRRPCDSSLNSWWDRTLIFHLESGPKMEPCP